MNKWLFSQIVFFFFQRVFTTESRWEGSWGSWLLQAHLFGRGVAEGGGKVCSEGTGVSSTCHRDRCPAAWGHLRKTPTCHPFRQPAVLRQCLWFSPGHTMTTHRNGKNTMCFPSGSQASPFHSALPTFPWTSPHLRSSPHRFLPHASLRMHLSFHHVQSWIQRKNRCL